jgi:DNA primase small subunit
MSAAEGADYSDSQDVEQDMTMADAGVQGQTIPAPEIKQEIKLEDLFADIESDEEFPSSNARDIKISSSPEAPASPM